MKDKMEYTESEKVLISNAMFDIFYELECARAVLWAVEDIYFGKDPVPAIPAKAAETLGFLLRVYLGEINSAIEQYKEIVGEAG